MPESTSLTQFPRPSVAVDTAVLCPVPVSGLHVLLIRSEDGRWQLPGSILRPQERLAEAVARCLREKARLIDRSPVQLHVFDQPDRDDRGWVISVAHLDVLAAADVGLDPEVEDGAGIGAEDFATAWRTMVPVDAVAELSAEHQEIVRVAVHRLRSLHERSPDPFGLLGSEFSLRRLRTLHEIVAGTELQADTFRRTMLPLLEATGRALTQGRGRPAQTFRRRAEFTLQQDTPIVAVPGTVWAGVHDHPHPGAMREKVDSGVGDGD
ncbi:MULTISPECIES: NUDIX hydrolase [Brevibacterium]|nr:MULTISPECIES: NUDIX domain-containing protein [Brevibacterium]